MRDALHQHHSLISRQGEHHGSEHGFVHQDPAGQGDDAYSYSEDVPAKVWLDGKRILLDVMANDLGGNAKTLYSIDNGDALTGSAEQGPGPVHARGRRPPRATRSESTTARSSSSWPTVSTSTRSSKASTYTGHVQVRDPAGQRHDKLRHGHAELLRGERRGACCPAPWWAWTRRTRHWRRSGKLTVTDLDDGQVALRGSDGRRMAATASSASTPDGNWSYIAKEAFDGLNVGDSV